MLPETVVAVRGHVVATAQAPSGVEVQSPEFTVISAPTDSPPFELRRPTINPNRVSTPRPEPATRL